MQTTIKAQINAIVKAKSNANNQLNKQSTDRLKTQWREQIALLNDAQSSLAAFGLMLANMEARVKEIKSHPRLHIDNWYDNSVIVNVEELITELKTLESYLGHTLTELPIRG